MSENSWIAIKEKDLQLIASGHCCEVCARKNKCKDVAQVTCCAAFQYDEFGEVDKGLPSEKRLEEEQHMKLRGLKDILEDALYSEPADSGDETEEAIWKAANDLKSWLDDLLEKEE